MSTSIAESNQKAAQRNQQLAQLGIRVNPDPGHLDYLLQIAPKTVYGPNALSSQAQIDFDIKFSPSYFLKDNRSIILAIKASESGGSASVKPSFVEAFFDRGTSFEWYCDSAPLWASHMMQTVLEPAIELSDTEYASLCNCLNHNSSLTYTSPASISAGGSQWYFVRVPNPFPKTGIWLGAMESQTWTLRLKTQSGGAVDSGTGTLVLSDLQLLLESVLVPDTDFAELKRVWKNHHWTATSAVVNEPNPVTLTSTGESPKIQLTQLRGMPVTSIYSFIHQSRNIAASAYFNFQALGNASKVHLIDRNGTQLFTSNSEFYSFQRYYRGARQMADSKLLQSVPLILNNPSPNIQGKIHTGHDSAKYIMTGDEYLVITDSGLSTSSYVDSIAFYDCHYTLRDGVITKVGY